MKILTLSKTYVSESYRKKVHYWAENSNHEIGLICPTSWGSLKYEKPERNEPFYFKELPIAFTGKNHFHYYQGLKKVVEEFRPDIFNIEEEHYSFVTYQAYKLAKKVGAKPMFFAWQNINKAYPPPFNWIEKYIFKHSAFALCGSQNAADILRKKGYRGSYKVSPQVGIDLSRFTDVELNPAYKQKFRHELNLPPNDFLILSAGRIVAEKGYSTLLEALKQYKVLSDTLDITAIIIGDGPYLENLKQEAASLGVEKLVRFIGKVPSVQMDDYMKASDMMCLASRTKRNWKEQGAVRVLQEAMASGSAICASDSGEIPLIVGNAGKIFREGDACDLLSNILALKNDRNLLLSLCNQAQRRVASNFSAEVVAKNFLEVFEAV